jgi:hypothetical protein
MAGTNNFQVFAENTSNCMSDADYTDSTSRESGVIDGLADGTLYNKAEHQATIMAAAIASITADKGVNVSDTSLTALKSALLSMQAYPTAGGTATAITLNLPTLVNGYSVTFIAAYSNSGASTRINGYFLYKPNTATAPTLVAGKAYTAWYSSSSDCFFVKASAEGTAVAADVLAGKTFSNDNDTGLTGTLALSGTVTAADVLSGKTFYSTDPKSKFTGTLALVGTAAAADVLSGKTFYSTDAKSKLTGTLILSSSMNGSIEYATAGTYSWTVPAGVTRIIAIIASAGGGGGGGISTSSSNYSAYSGGGGGGGGAGACVIKLIDVTPNISISIIVGAGGSGGNMNNNGGNGGSSSVDYFFLSGGGGGKAGTAAAYGIGGDGGLVSHQITTELASIVLGSDGKDGDGGSGNQMGIFIGGDGGDGSNASGILSVGGTLSFSITGTGGTGSTQISSVGGSASGYCAGGGGGKGGGYSGNYENGSAGGAGSGGYVKIFY